MLVHNAGEGCRCEIDGVTFDLQLRALGANDARIICNGVSRDVVFSREGTTLHLHQFGRAWSVSDLTLAASHREARAGGDGRLRASMNGRVIGVWVAVGDAVARGQPILTLEAMKMEHVHLAPIAGRIVALSVGVGDLVGTHRVMAQIEPAAPHDDTPVPFQPSGAARS
jgi:geranyl-CoA carboxylase alpha subunit